ncbi:tannase/feruloyl esterase family alpha/beta hydrolase [Vibrio mexicanus]|uniref:tannase/feruloyl esterase family alpha/beta hydrolase n=1 Tax=Vibrio mexicanus TaxID=1004326 RepID=UPI00063C699C|nr:tannase/feruloyl esterase family alpha/beta hydrolase [Vibrio mexicanus]
MSNNLIVIPATALSVFSLNAIANQDIHTDKRHFEHPINSAFGECQIESMPPLKDVKYLTAQRDDTHCIVHGVIEEEINFQVRLPHDWNGMFAQSGGGGFAGVIVDYIDAVALGPGYATAGTDTGHQAHPLESNWATNTDKRDTRLENFGGRAIHLTTQTSKAIIESYYQQQSERNLFYGCSRGGGQGLFAAQRYPSDYDVIIAGSPAYDWTHRLGGLFSAIANKMFPDPNNIDEAILGTAEIELINQTATAQCSNQDGTDNRALNEPWNCSIDFKALQCSDENNENCLTAAQVEVSELIYQGLYDSEGNQLAEGYYLGAS